MGTFESEIASPMQAKSAGELMDALTARVTQLSLIETDTPPTEEEVAIAQDLDVAIAEARFVVRRQEKELGLMRQSLVVAKSDAKAGTDEDAAKLRTQLQAAEQRALAAEKARDDAIAATHAANGQLDRAKEQIEAMGKAKNVLADGGKQLNFGWKRHMLVELEKLLAISSKKNEDFGALLKAITTYNDPESTAFDVSVKSGTLKPDGEKTTQAQMRTF